MTESLPYRTSPNEESLKFLREFARFYQPEMGDDVDEVEYLFNNSQKGNC